MKYLYCTNYIPEVYDIFLNKLSCVCKDTVTVTIDRSIESI